MPTHNDSQTLTVQTNEDVDFDNETFVASIGTVEDTLQIKVLETKIYPGLRNTAHNALFIVTRLVLQVIIDDAKFTNTTRINDTDE